MTNTSKMPPFRLDLFYVHKHDSMGKKCGSALNLAVLGGGCPTSL